MSELFHLESTAPQKTPRVILSPQRRAVMEHLKSKDTISLDEAVKLIGGNIYANERFHVGNTLSAMVKAGLLKRLKPGLFAKA